MNEPEYKKYLEQARRNEELVFLLSERKYSQKIYINFIFVVIFYSALHYFSAFLVYKGEELPKTHKKYKNKLGYNELAEDIFYTTGNNDITCSAGTEYIQLFQWGYDARYTTESSVLLGGEEIKLAIECLDIIKMVVFNEIGYKPKIENGKIKLKKVKREYLKRIYDIAKK